VLFLAKAPPLWVRGAGAGAGAAIAAVAVRAGLDLLGPSYRRAEPDRWRAARWAVYLVLGAVAAALIGPYLVLVLVGCGLLELMVRRQPRPPTADARGGELRGVLPIAATKGALGSLTWTAFKVGALAFGGGFVIVPLMQSDAVHVYHWMSQQSFLNAVALGQVTPGPVVATVAAVGYAAHGVGGGVLAGAVAFTPSFSFVLLGGARFERLRGNRSAAAFLGGAGPAAIGAILGAAVNLGGALHEGWQLALLGAGGLVLLVGRVGVVPTLVGAGVVGAAVALAGGPLP
jgi:chromate transporter